MGALVSLLLLATSSAEMKPLFGFLFMCISSTTLSSPSPSAAVLRERSRAVDGHRFGPRDRGRRAFGGGIAPVAVGQLAQRIGIQHILWLPVVMMAVGMILSLFTGKRELSQFSADLFALK